MPLLAKLSPDGEVDDLIAVGRLLASLGIDGVIATNTTVTRSPVVDCERHCRKEGGLSGQPLLAMSLQAIAALKDASAGPLTIIGVGGVMSTADAKMMLQAGADLLQVYTGLIYTGPSLIRELIGIARQA